MSPKLQGNRPLSVQLLECIERHDLGQGPHLGGKTETRQLSHVSEMPIESPEDKWNAWASISNDCRFEWTDNSLKPAAKRRKHVSPSLASHFFATSSERHPPASPRLRLLHLQNTSVSEKAQTNLENLIVRLVKKDMGLNPTVRVSSTFRKRRFAVPQVHHELFSPIEGVANMAFQRDRDLAERFSEEIATSGGKIWWRKHKRISQRHFEDTIVMNDVATVTSCALSPNTFAQIDFETKSTTGRTDVVQARCTCDQAKAIHVALSADQRAVGIDGCTHVKFLQSHVMPLYHSIFDGPAQGDGVLLHKLRESSAALSRPVALLSHRDLLGEKNREAVKYSVTGPEAVATVYLSFIRTISDPICIMKCKKFQCRGLRTKGIVPTKELLDVDVDDCCEHLRVLWGSGNVQRDFDWCFNPPESAGRPTDNNTDAADNIESHPANNTDASENIESYPANKCFDKRKGMWIYNSFVGIHGYNPCRDLHNPSLATWAVWNLPAKFCNYLSFFLFSSKFSISFVETFKPDSNALTLTALQNEACAENWCFPLKRTSLLSIQRLRKAQKQLVITVWVFSLVGLAPNTSMFFIIVSGSWISLQCLMETVNEISRNPILYTRWGPVQLIVLVLQCTTCGAQANSNKILQRHQIFQFSSESAFGDEMFHDYLLTLFRSKLTLQGHCDSITTTYTSMLPKCRPFVSRTTFKEALFSWMACHKIDFRSPDKSCPICQKKVSAIVVDGVQVTPADITLDYSRGVTKVDKDDQKPVVPGWVQSNVYPLGAFHCFVTCINVFQTKKEIHRGPQSQGICSPSVRRSSGRTEEGSWEERPCQGKEIHVQRARGDAEAICQTLLAKRTDWMHWQTPGVLLPGVICFQKSSTLAWRCHGRCTHASRWGVTTLHGKVFNALLRQRRDVNCSAFAHSFQCQGTDFFTGTRLPSWFSLLEKNWAHLSRVDRIVTRDQRHFGAGMCINAVAELVFISAQCHEAHQGPRWQLWAMWGSFRWRSETLRSIHGGGILFHENWWTIEEPAFIPQ